MGDETEIRPGREDHARDAHGERASQQSPLQGRAAFIKNWDWQLVTSLNRGSCDRGKALHGNNSETHEHVRHPIRVDGASRKSPSGKERRLMSDAPVQTQAGLESQPPMPVRRFHNSISCLAPSSAFALTVDL